VNVADAAQIELRFDGTTCRLAVITADGRTPAGSIKPASPRIRVRFARESGRWTLRCNEAVAATLPPTALPQPIPGRISLTFTQAPAHLIGLEARGDLRPDWLRAALAE